jgi:hypothetical protein
MDSSNGRVVGRMALTILAALALIASSYQSASATTTYTCYTGYALSIGGWGASKKGEALLEASGNDWVDVVNSLCLVDANGNSFDLDDQDSFATNYAKFSSWLLGPVRGNMAYNLSKQMVAVALTLEVGNLDFIDVPWVTWESSKVELWDLIDEASDLVCLHPYTRGGGNPARKDQEKYKDFFTSINENLTAVCEPHGTTLTTDIRIFKFYDLNLNGVHDAGEVGIANWPFELYDATGTTLIDTGVTDSQGMLTFTVAQDNTQYLVVEVLQEPYINITPLSQTAVADQDYVDLDFGNVAIQCHYGLGKTLGFWSNPNGKSTLAGAFPDWVNTLNSYHLRNAAGARVTFSTANNDVAHGELNSFLLGGAATNMANMLSIQLAASILDVVAGDMSSHPGIFVEWDGSMVNIWDVFAEADDLLRLHAVTISSSAARDAQEDLKDFFDDLNKNDEPVHVVLPGPVPFGPLPCIGGPTTTSLPASTEESRSSTESVSRTNARGPARSGARTRPSRR